MTTIQNTPAALSLRVAKGIVSGLFTQAVTVLLGLAIVPYMVRTLGNDGYALLSFSLSFIGYMAFLDLGLSNSMVRFLSEYEGLGDAVGKQDVLSTAICLYPVLGLTAGTVLAVVTPFFVRGVLSLPAELHATALLVFYITAVGLPVVLLKAYFESIPMAHQRISTLNGLNLLINATKLVCSAGLLYIGFGLVAVVTANVVMTLLHVLVLVWLSFKCLPKGFRIEFRLKTPVLKALLTNGFFVSATHVTSLLSLNLDRLLIAAFLPLSAVAYYVVPYELASKMWYIPTHVNRAHYPMFGYLWGQRNLELMRQHFQQAVRQTVVGISFIAILVVVYAQEILHFWIGSEYGQLGARALQLLAMGTLMNCWSNAPCALMVAINRAKTTARIRFFTMALNIVMCLILIPRFGINGAAFACFGAFLVDALMLFWTVERTVFAGTFWWLLRQVILPTGLISALILGLVLAVASVNGIASLMLVCSGSYVTYLAATYYFILSETERQTIRSLLNPMSQRGTG